jgi:hypothetical protein
MKFRLPLAAILASLTKMMKQLEDYIAHSETQYEKKIEQTLTITERADDKATSIINHAEKKAEAVWTKADEESTKCATEAGELAADRKKAEKVLANLKGLMGE